MKTGRPQNDCEKWKCIQTVKKTHGERERVKKEFLLVCCCITDVLRSCGLHILSHVVVRDVSPSLPGLLHCHISLSLKYAPVKAHYDAKIKKRDRKECNYADLSRKKRLFEEPYSH